MELNRNEFGPKAPATGNDEEVDKDHLLRHITGELFHNDYLQRMVEEKDVPLDIPQIRELISNDESKEHKQFRENARLDYLLRMKNTLNEKFDNSARLHPHGMTEYDYKCIPEERRPGLEKFKMKIRGENYVYLSLHPDIDAMISLFMQKVIKVQPAEPVKFAGEFFTYRGTPYTDFVKQIDEEKKRLKRYRTRSFHSNSRELISTAARPPVHPGNNVWRHWGPAKFEQVNQVKKLSLGPLALGFGVTPPPTAAHSPRQKSKVLEQPTKKETTPLMKTQPVKKFYCGCKDPGRMDYRRKTKPELQLCVENIEGEEQETSITQHEAQDLKPSSSSVPNENDKSEEVSSHEFSENILSCNSKSTQSDFY